MGETLAMEDLASISDKENRAKNANLIKRMVKVPLGKA